MVVHEQMVKAGFIYSTDYGILIYVYFGLPYAILKFNNKLRFLKMRLWGYVKHIQSMLHVFSPKML